MTKRLSFERPEEILAADKVANPQRYEQPKGRFLVFQRLNHTVVYKETKNGDFEHNGKRWSFYRSVYDIDGRTVYRMNFNTAPGITIKAI